MLFKARQRTAAGPKVRTARDRVSFGGHSCAVDGYGMDPVMRRLLAERGVVVRLHHARRLTGSIVREADLVLVTERRQVDRRRGARSGVARQGLSARQWEDSDVADPHGGAETAYRESLVLIEHLVMGWLNKIC